MAILRVRRPVATGIALIEPSGYELRNAGDNAMLAVAVHRLLTIRGGRVRVVTSEPERLRKLCSEVTPQSAAARDQFLKDPIIQAAAMRAPLPLLRLMLAARYARHEFVRTLAASDALVFSGAGALNDEFYDHAQTWLVEIIVAKALGKRVIMFGQGIGPLSGPHLRRTASRALGMADLVCLRESAQGPQLLHELGVPEARYVVTGDDALSLITPTTFSSQIGEAVGVNVRASDYSGIDRDSAVSVTERVAAYATRLGRSTIGVAISEHEADSDDLGAGVPYLRGALNPLAMARQIAAKLNFVVTGSYHAGVFALASGLPVIGLIGSDYYRGKFEGLRSQFPVGVSTVELGPSWQVDLERAMEEVTATDVASRRAIWECARKQREHADSVACAILKRSRMGP